MVAVWICSVQLANKSKEDKLKSEGSLSLLVLPSNWSADFMGGWLYFCYWPQRRQHLKSVLKIDDEDMSQRSYYMSSNIVIHRT